MYTVGAIQCAGAARCGLHMVVKEHPPDPGDDGDRIASQLRRLSTRPVDTSGVEQRVRSLLGLPVTTRTPTKPARFTMVRFAAVFVAAVSAVGILAWYGARPVVASAMELSQAHAENIRGEPEAVPVTSMAEAHRLMCGKWNRCPHLTEPARGEVVSCHIHVISGKQLLCVRLSVDGVPVTLAVGHISDFRLPNVSPTTCRNHLCFVQNSGDTNIVTTDGEGLWLSAIGHASTDRLVEISGDMTFVETVHQ